MRAVAQYGANPPRIVSRCDRVLAACLIATRSAQPRGAAASALAAARKRIGKPARVAASVYETIRASFIIRGLCGGDTAT
ncbi:hypothetical protein J7355_12365 [Endozoicomonas sp. G2_2]|uniref:hypothetical protein n=1 Tax=Endozoicomonas sp. G2_2 TaxID=2821092 RepID=UPI001ADBB9CA|nr:hypothetical protein [Endozoicomonas sp. G2_2]MBO9470897.1 hypothetical protein [Endozoicomonas sp. G2_2]